MEQKTLKNIETYIRRVVASYTPALLDFYAGENPSHAKLSWNGIEGLSLTDKNKAFLQMNAIEMKDYGLRKSGNLGYTHPIGAAYLFDFMSSLPFFEKEATFRRILAHNTLEDALNYNCVALEGLCRKWGNTYHEYIDSMILQSTPEIDISGENTSRINSYAMVSKMAKIKAIKFSENPSEQLTFAYDIMSQMLETSHLRDHEERKRTLTGLMGYLLVILANMRSIPDSEQDIILNFAGAFKELHKIDDKDVYERTKTWNDVGETEAHYIPKISAAHLRKFGYSQPHPFLARK